MIIAEQFGDITQLKMGRDLDGRVLYWVAAYLVDDLLIDTGCRHTAEELIDYLEDKPVQLVYVTHYHEDHIGGCALLQEKLNLKTRANPHSIELAGSAPPLYPYQELVWGYPRSAEFLELTGAELKTENYTFQVVETPGHSPDHTVLIEPEHGWCFSGDLFVSEKIRVLRPEENIKAIMQSMEDLLFYEPADPNQELTLFTSIGRVVTQGRESIRNCLDYLEDIGAEAACMHHDQGLSTEEIVERLFNGESSLAELTNNQFASKHLINSLLKYS